MRKPLTGLILKRTVNSTDNRNFLFNIQESNFTIATILGLDGNATLADIEAAQFNLTGEVLDDLVTFTETQEAVEEAIAAGAEVITYTASDLPDNITIAQFPEGEYFRD